jgi:hypothetical protein
MDAAARAYVRARAENRCEYCRLPQSAAPYLKFHVEHVQAQQHVSDDSTNNLALACPACNRHKGPNLSTVHPQSRSLVRLFHPRADVWEDHFEFRGALIVGLTDIGEATVRLLQMNNEDRVELRMELLANGEL